MNNDLEETKPRHLPTATPPLDPFASILQTASTGLKQSRKGFLDEGIEGLEQDDSLLIPDWLNFDPEPTDESKIKLPSWMVTRADDDLIAQKGLPQARRSPIPDWMKELGPDQKSPGIDLSKLDLVQKADANKKKKKFDPNATQKTKAVKRIKWLTKFASYLKNNKAIRAFLVLILAISFGNIVTSLVPTMLDNIVADIVYIAMYKWLASIGYDAKDLFLHSKP